MKLFRFFIDCFVKLVVIDKNISIWGKIYNLYLCSKIVLFKNFLIYCVLRNFIDFINWYCVFLILYLSKKI